MAFENDLKKAKIFEAAKTFVQETHEGNASKTLELFRENFGDEITVSLPTFIRFLKKTVVPEEHKSKAAKKKGGSRKKKTKREEIIEELERGAAFKVKDVFFIK